jgi:predicted small secreted protein
MKSKVALRPSGVHMEKQPYTKRKTHQNRYKQGIFRRKINNKKK